MRQLRFAGAQRRPQGFNLAFLDIMACGLGAIILVFMLVKYHTAESGADGGALRAEAAALRAEAARIDAGNRALAQQVEALEARLKSRIAEAARARSAGETAAGAVARLTAEIAQLESQVARAKARAAAPTEAPPKEQTAEEHLIGLAVRGERILILLDSSTSMTHEFLNDINQAKVRSADARRAAPKWRRARAVVDWILARVPADSRYRLIHYNADAAHLPADRWLDGDDDKARSAVAQALDALHPNGATDLSAALQLTAKITPAPTDIYVITDGLPTDGQLPLTKRLGVCRALFQARSQVTGDCRNALFYAAVQDFAANDRGAVVNVVLLPIEGDPDAGYAYWLWASTTTGLLISPAESWP